MKEQTLTFREACKKGVSLGNYPTPNTDSFEYISGVVPSDGGMHIYEPLEKHDLLDLEFRKIGFNFSVWPFPQYIETRLGGLAFGVIGKKGYIAKVTWSNEVPTLSLITMTNAHTLASIAYLKVHAATWHIADFGAWIFVTDGVDHACINFPAGTAEVSLESDTASPHLSVGTCCNFNNRLVLGDLTASSKWMSAFGTPAGFTPSSSHVWVSSPSGEDTRSLIHLHHLYGKEELCPDPTFDNAAAWTLGDFTVGGGYLVWTNKVSATMAPAQTIDISIGMLYKITIDITTIGSSTVTVDFGGHAEAITTTGLHTFVVCATGYTQHIDATSESNSSGAITYLSIVPLASKLSGILINNPWDSKVLSVQPFSTGIVTYCSDGVLGCKKVLLEVPAPVPTVQATFSSEFISERGIFSRDSICTTGSRHVYVGADNRLHTVGSDFSESLLGGFFLLSELQSTSKVRMFRDPIKDEIWIGQLQIDGTPVGYMFTQNGLVQVPQAVDSLFTRAGMRYAVSNPIADTEDRTFELRTEAFDMGLPSVSKFLRFVEVEAPGVEDLTVAISYLPLGSLVWVELDPITANEQNALCSLVCVGLRYKLTIRGSITSSACLLSSINVKWQLEDRRNM